MFTKVKLLLFLFFLLMLCFPAISQNEILVFGKMKLEQGRLDGKLELLKNGTRVRIVNMSGSGKFEQELELNARYIFSFSQDGYVTKKIEVNTKVSGSRPEDAMPLSFEFKVTLFKQYEGVNFVVFNQPVAKILYDPNIDNFDYDTDYTKSIQERISAVEKEVEIKKKEEEELAKQLEKEEKERLAQEEADEEERKKQALEQAEKEEKAEKERLALLAAEQKEKDALAKDKSDQEAKAEKEKLALALAADKEKDKLAKEKEDQLEKEEQDRIAKEKKDQKEQDRIAQEKEEEKNRKPPPPVTSKQIVKKEDPPTKPKKLRPPPTPTTKKPVTGVVVLHSYTVGEMGYPNLSSYGYIHFGDGTGRREITKEQFDEYAKIYH